MRERSAKEEEGNACCVNWSSIQAFTSRCPDESHKNSPGSRNPGRESDLTTSSQMWDALALQLLRSITKSNKGVNIKWRGECC